MLDYCQGFKIYYIINPYDVWRVEMNPDIIGKMKGFLDILGLSEEPMGIYYTNETPAKAISPNLLDLPTREKELADEISPGGKEQSGSCRLGPVCKKILQDRRTQFHGPLRYVQ
jgi:hypothetical protein